MKSIECFAIEDHGMLENFPEVNEHNFKYMVVERATTTFATLALIADRISNMGFDAEISIKPLLIFLVPALEPEDGKQHFITVRWS